MNQGSDTIHILFYFNSIQGLHNEYSNIGIRPK